MTENQQLLYEDFKDRIGSVFTPLDVEPSRSLTLDEAEPLLGHFTPAGIRPPFSLIFVETGDAVMPQGLYRLQHAEMGEVTIFLVPIGKDQRGVSYQATFN